jgi:hypothetical protein
MWVEADVCSRKQGRTRLSVRVVTQSPLQRAIGRALELAALTSRGRRGSRREQESARLVLALLVATSCARSSSIEQTRHQKVASFVVEISVWRSPPMPKPYSYDLRKKVIEAPHARWYEEK